MTKQILLLSLFSPVFAHANVDAIRATEKACFDQAQSSVAMMDCIETAYKAADLELNTVYKQIVAQLTEGIETDKKLGLDPAAGNAEILKRLVAAQRAWIAFRDANCRFEGTEGLGGTMEPLITSGCITETTLDRVTRLVLYANPDR